MQTSVEELHKQTQTQLGEINDALENGTFKQLGRMLNGLQPAEIAHLIESSPPASRSMLWHLLDNPGEVLQELSDDVRSHFLSRMDTAEVAELTEGLDTDDAADLLQQLPDQVIREVLSAMSTRDRQRVESVLSYDEETAGGLMNTDTITVRPPLTLDVVLRFLRRHDEIPRSTDNLIVVNRKDEFVGLLPLTKLLTSPPNITVREIMITDIDPIPASMPDHQVAKLFERHDWISAPVVDEQGKLLGRITIDDVVDVIREDADHSFMSLHGLDEEEDTFARVASATPRRAIWLAVNMVATILAAAVISTFQATIEKVVVLAVLMPIVASMGGVAGSQTLSVMIRGLALGQIGRTNIGWLLSREFWISAINGVLLALAMGLLVAWWFDDIKIAMIIGAAIIINLVVSAIAGTLIPITLKSLKIDPALAGGVALITVTDVVGFLSFLGLATYFYM